MSSESKHNTDLVRLQTVIEKERADPDNILGGTYNEGFDDALCWVLDEIHGLLNDGKECNT